MTRRIVPIVTAALLLVVQAIPVCHSAEDGCDSLHFAWVAAFERLRASTDSIRHIKEGSLASRIQEELRNRRNGGSLARSVRAVLQERSAALDRERSTCRSLAVQENQAFEQWRRCASRGNHGRGGFQAAGLGNVSGERKKVLGSLQDLLIDEAYVQYKNYRQPTPPAYSGYEQQPWGYGRNLGYRSYPGYGGYR